MHVLILVPPFISLLACAHLALADNRMGIVPNRIIFPAIGICLIMQAVFCLSNDIRLQNAWLIPVLIIASSLLYFIDIWGAGDGKLITLLVLSYPIPIWQDVPAMFLLLIPAIAFVLGYAKCIIDTIISIRSHSITREEMIRLAAPKELAARLGFSGLVSCLVLMILSRSPLYGRPLVHISIFLFTDWIMKHMLKSYLLRLRSSSISYFLYLFTLAFQLLSGIDPIPFIAISLLLLLMNLLSYGNYKVIEIGSLENGMILSSASRIELELAGIMEPIGKYEMISDKLDEKSIKRITGWAKRNGHGSKTLTIVRTIPFVGYIFAGDLICFLLVAAYEIRRIL